MTDTHPLRIAADVVDGNVTHGGVTETFLDSLKKRTALVLTPTETLSSFNFATGSPPYSVIYGQTGFVYFYNPDDTTTADDGSTCLVSGDGRRYILADMSAVEFASVLATQNAPPVSPTDGDAYIVGTSPTGAWAANAKDIALYTPRGWVFATPKVGTALLNQATGGNLQYNAAGSWAAMPTTIAASGVTPFQLLFPMGLSVEAQQNAPPGSPVAGDGLYYLVGTSPSGLWTGHANDIATYDLTSTWVFLDAYAGAMIYNKASSAQLVWNATSGVWAPPSPIASICQARLTTVSNTPITTTDQTAKATIYLTPFRGNGLALYVNGAWALRTLSEISLSLSGYTTGKPYDIFVYDNAGTPTLESLVWTNDTTRATALALQDGVLVNSGDATRRYVGTIYTTATGQTEDSLAKRMVWNYYNRVARPLKVIDTTDGWVYSTSTIRQANGSASNKIEVIIGVAEDLLSVEVIANAHGGVIVGVGIGLDSTTSYSGFFSRFLATTTSGSDLSSGVGRYVDNPGVGRHFFAWLEWASGGTVTWAGDGGGIVQSGLSGTVRG